MDVLTLSRIQFAVATMFHFLFVPLTLGLSLLVAIMETMWVRTGNVVYQRMAKFWGKLFLINFAIGIVTGLTLEFQFGTNWSRYSMFVGDIFGSLLAIEATVAFFLESTFIAVWFFGWKKLTPKMHCTAIWIVAIASSISAYWILAANAWMQHPVGYEIRNGRAELTNFWEIITQEYAIYEFTHTLTGAFAVGGFFVLGISAWHLLRRSEMDFFKKSFKLGAIFSLVATVLVLGIGHANGAKLAELQPLKLAAMEAHWETTDRVPIYGLTIPDVANERNLLQILPFPRMLSVLATHDPNATVKGLKEWPKEERPPVLITFLSFRMMVGFGILMLLFSTIAVIKHKTAENYPLLLKALIVAIPFPYLANEFGWMLTEFGRQPWVVYGIMKTKDAVSPIAAGQVLVTTIAFVIVYGLLGAADFFLLYTFAKKGPSIIDQKGNHHA